MGNTVPNSTVKARTKRSMTYTLCMHPQQALCRFCNLRSGTALWKAPLGLKVSMKLSREQIKVSAPSPEADTGVVGSLTLVHYCFPPIWPSVLSSNWSAPLGMRSRNSLVEGWRQLALKSFLSGDSVTKDNICLSCMFNLCLIIQRAGKKMWHYK